MAFEAGNQWWKNRTRSGRKRIFESPQLMWEAACEYFEWATDNPLKEETIQVLKVNGEGEKIQREDLPKLRAFSIKSLCLYLDCNADYFRQFKENIKTNNTIDDKLKEEFSWVISRIEDVIYVQKFEGSAAGMLNANIISRELGLMDKHDVNLNAEVKTSTTIKWGDKEVNI